VYIIVIAVVVIVVYWAYYYYCYTDANAGEARALEVGLEWALRGTPWNLQCMRSESIVRENFRNLT